MAETKGQGQRPRRVAFPSSTEAAPLLDCISSSNKRVLLGRICICIGNLFERSSYLQFIFDKETTEEGEGGEVAREERWRWCVGASCGLNAVGRSRTVGVLGGGSSPFPLSHFLPHHPSDSFE